MASSTVGTYVNREKQTSIEGRQVLKRAAFILRVTSNGTTDLDGLVELRWVDKQFLDKACREVKRIQDFESVPLRHPGWICPEQIWRIHDYAVHSQY